MAKEKAEKKEKEKKKPKYENVSKKYEKLMEELFDKQPLPLNVNPSEIVILQFNRKAPQGVFGQTHLVYGVYEFLTEFKYFIVLFEENMKHLDDNQVKYVLLHEYFHCVVDEERNKYYLRKHDVQNFGNMLEKPTWKLDLVKDFKNSLIKKDNDGEVERDRVDEENNDGDDKDDKDDKELE
jgi:hypothetical protein